ncbi:MAG: N-6 DNA methylase [Bacilli bacterium]|nr:N-6 DNA methylase [Bacilli bacterium]
MSENKNKIIDIFRSNIKGYLAINDLQTTISGITFYYWAKKFRDTKNSVRIYSSKDKFSNSLSNYKSEAELCWKLIDNLMGSFNFEEHNRIYDYLDTLTEQELINIICDDYGMNSRFDISTPETISELVYNILETNNNLNDYSKVLDICSYTGNFLTYYAKRKIDYLYTGLDINKSSNLIAELKLRALDASFEIIEDDALLHHFDTKYDKIFCNFPFGLKINPETIENMDNIVGKLSKGSSGWPFVNAVINSLSENGKAVVVINNGELYKLPDQEYRRRLVELGYVEAVISLPDKMFNNTAIPVTLLVLSRNNKEIKFINAEKLCSRDYISSKSTQLNIDAIMREFNSNIDSDNKKTVAIYDLEKTAYSLYVQNYMNVKNIEIKCPKKLYEVCFDVFRGYQISSNELTMCSDRKENTKEYKIVNIKDVNEGNIDKDLVSIFVDTDKYDRYVLEDNDLLISSKGTLSKFAVVSALGNKYIPSGNFTVLRLNKNIINPYYLKMFFESNKGKAVIDSIKSGGVLPAINLQQLKEINIPVPSIEEQINIVKRYLAKEDEIKAVKLQLNKLEEKLVDLANEEF